MLLDVCTLYHFLSFAVSRISEYGAIPFSSLGYISVDLELNQEDCLGWASSNQMSPLIEGEESRDSLLLPTQKKANSCVVKEGTTGKNLRAASRKWEWKCYLTLRASIHSSQRNQSLIHEITDKWIPTTTCEFGRGHQALDEVPAWLTPWI